MGGVKRTKPQFLNRLSLTQFEDRLQESGHCTFTREEAATPSQFPWKSWRRRCVRSRDCSVRRVRRYPLSGGCVLPALVAWAIACGQLTTGRQRGKVGELIGVAAEWAQRGEGTQRSFIVGRTNACDGVPLRVNPTVASSDMLTSCVAAGMKAHATPPPNRWVGDWCS